MPFVDMDGVNTNVYSFFYEIILDFGYAPSLFIALVLGSMHAYIDNNEVVSKTPETILLGAGSKLGSVFSFAAFSFFDTFFLVVVFLYAVICLVRRVKLELPTKSRHPV